MFLQSSLLPKQNVSSHHDHVMSWEANTDQLPAEQSMFKKHYLSNNKLFELTLAICQAQPWSRRIGAIFLDIEKALATIWHNGLHYKLLHLLLR